MMFEQTFLDEYGAAIGDGNHVGVSGSDPAACPPAFITLMPGFSLLRVAGGDAGSFLHGQLTADVQQLADGAGSTAAWCSPKGRVITTFALYRLGDEFYLLLPSVLQERVLKRLRMFVLRADVQITDVSAARTIMAVRGRAQSIPESARGFSIRQLNGRLHLFLPDAGGSRCLIVDDTPALQAVWKELAETMPPADSRCWDRLDLETGIVWLNDATTEQFLPQELNLEDSGGLSFSKGCYPGQEVVARVHYRGQVKRRLYAARCEADSPPQPGHVLRDANGKNAGMLVSALPVENGWQALAVIDSGAAEDGKVTIENTPLLHIAAASPSQA